MPALSRLLTLDLASAYVLTLSRVIAWAGVSAIVYRNAGPGALALLVLVRATTGLLVYLTAGIGPTMIHLLSQFAPTAPGADRKADAPSSQTLAYRDRRAIDDLPADADLQRLYRAAILLSLAIGALALVPLAAYTKLFSLLHEVSFAANKNSVGTVQNAVMLMGVGVLLRGVSEPAGAMLQIRNRLWWDNLLLAMTEWAWLGLCAVALAGTRGTSDTFATVAAMFTNSGFLLLAVRLALAELTGRKGARVRVRWRWSVIRAILFPAAVLSIAQAADFLYAPTDYVIINRLLDPVLVAAYAPALQIDAALFMLVSAVSAVILPRAARASAAGDHAALWRYYVSGTIVTGCVLLLAAIVVWIISPWLLRAWLGDVMPQTQDILPLVLVHTVIGGSSAVGRAILLGMGRFRAFTIAALLSGGLNVVLSILFGWVLGWGLNGVIVATIVAVTLRCVVWMPWYVLRCLRSGVAVDSQPVPVAAGTV